MLRCMEVLIIVRLGDWEGVGRSLGVWSIWQGWEGRRLACMNYGRICTINNIHLSTF
jgi:hypothetical protein